MKNVKHGKDDLTFNLSHNYSSLSVVARDPEDPFTSTFQKTLSIKYVIICIGILEKKKNSRETPS